MCVGKRQCKHHQVKGVAGNGLLLDAAVVCVCVCTMCMHVDIWRAGCCVLESVCVKSVHDLTYVGMCVCKHHQFEGVEGNVVALVCVCTEVYINLKRHTHAYSYPPPLSMHVCVYMVVCVYTSGCRR